MIESCHSVFARLASVSALLRFPVVFVCVCVCVCVCMACRRFLAFLSILFVHVVYKQVKEMANGFSDL